jgi:hypothetical protein
MLNVSICCYTTCPAAATHVQLLLHMSSCGYTTCPAAVTQHVQLLLHKMSSCCYTTCPVAVTQHVQLLLHNMSSCCYTTCPAAVTQYVQLLLHNMFKSKKIIIVFLIHRFPFISALRERLTESNIKYCIDQNLTRCLKTGKDKTRHESGWLILLRMWTSDGMGVRVAGWFYYVQRQVTGEVWVWLVDFFAYVDKWRNGRDSGWLILLRIETSDGKGVRVAVWYFCVCGQVTELVWEWLVDFATYRDK